MAKRFGRNQKRRLREELASVVRIGHAAKNYWMERAEDAERKLAKSVMVDVAVLPNPENGSLMVRAAFESRMHRDRIYNQHQLSREEIALQRHEDDRQRFVEFASKEIAHATWRGMQEYWGR